MSVFVKQADYQNERDVQDLTRMFREYARYENSDRPELDKIATELAAFPTSFSVLAYADPEQSSVVGLINCFIGFSTFQMRP